MRCLCHHLYIFLYLRNTSNFKKTKLPLHLTCFHRDFNFTFKIQLSPTCTNHPFISSIPYWRLFITIIKYYHSHLKSTFFALHLVYRWNIHSESCNSRTVCFNCTCCLIVLLRSCRPSKFQKHITSGCPGHLWEKLLTHTSEFVFISAQKTKKNSGVVTRKYSNRGTL